MKIRLTAHQHSVKALVLILLMMVVGACSGLAGEPEVVRTLPPAPTDLPSVPENFDAQVNIDQGAAIFAENCVRCHGITGAGDGELVLNGQVSNVPDFTDPLTTQDMSLQAWFDIITNGKLDALMPPWKDSLSAQQRWAVALYTYTLPYTRDSVTQGETLYTAQCVDCHGLDGSGSDTGSSLLGLVNYTQAELESAISTHQSELELSPAFDAGQLTNAAQYLRLLSSESQALPDPHTALSSAPEPAATEDVSDTNTAPRATSAPVPQTIGILRGQIIQGTEGGAPVEGLEAIVHIFDSQLREQIAEYTVGADGAYQYEEVIIRPDYAYFMTVEYDGVTYSSPIMIGDPEEDEMVIDVTIFEKGAEKSDIVLTSRATQVNLSSQGLYIIEVIDLVNISDRAYIREDAEGTDEAVSIEFALPEGAQLQLEHTDPDRIILSDDGLKIMDAAPVLPNREHYIQYSYILPIQDARDIQQPIEYTVDGPITFYIEDSHLIFSSDQTPLVDTLPFNGQSYGVYELEGNPEVGSTITYSIELSSTPGTANANNAQQTVPREVIAIVLVIGGVILVGIAGFAIWRGRTSSDDPEISDPTTPEDLMQAIAQLDHAFDAGELNKSEYKKQRDQLKSELMQLMKTTTNEE